MKPCTKWADRVYNLKRIPEQVNVAFQKAMSGKPGPVYLDFPGDVLYAKIPEEQVDWSHVRPAAARRAAAGRSQQGRCPDRRHRQGAPADHRVRQRRDLVAGLGGDCRQFVEKAGIPFYTTPQGRGVLPDDHAYSYLTMRSSAFRDADLIIVRRHAHELHHRPRRAAAFQRRRQDRPHRHRRRRNRHVAARKSTSASSATARRCCSQLIDAERQAHRRGSVLRLAQDAGRRRSGKASGARRQQADGRGDIHPLRLCEEIKNFMQRDAILVVDGQEILNYGRQSMPTFVAGASPQFRTVRHHGRRPAVRRRRQGRQARQAGDRRARRRLVRPQRAWSSTPRCATRSPILVVISLNGGWTADPDAQQAGPRPRLHALRQDGRGARLLRRVCRKARRHPPGARPRAARSRRGSVALVNVKTDYRARAGTAAFATYST